MADVPPPPPPAVVEELIVRAPRLAPLGGDVAFSAVQVTAEELKGSTRSDEALKQAPGVSLFRRTGSSAANPTTQGLSLRSIAPSGAGRALVTLDGAPQNDPFGGWVIWSALPPEGLDGANIVRGAGSGPYGAGALTGVVQLQERGTGDGLLSFGASAAERDSFRGVAVAGYGGLLATFAASRTDGYYAVRSSQRGAADERLKLSDYTGALRWTGDLNGIQTAARISYYNVHQNAGLRGARSNATGYSAALTLAQPADQGVGGWRLQGWWRHSDLENSSAAVAAGRTGTTPANDQYDTPADGYGLNAALQGVSGSLNWEFGGDVRLTDGEESELFRFMAGSFTRKRNAGGKTLVAGAYLEGALNEGPWIVTGGVRLDRSRAYDSFRVETDTANGAVLLNSSAPNRSDTTPTGRVGVRYAVNETLYLRGAAYAGFRPPNLNELHRPFRVGNDITEANPNLKPETLQGLEAGVGGDAGYVRWDATLFYNRLKDPITNVTIGIGPGTFPLAGFVPAGGTLRQRQNAGEIEAWGVEADLSGKPVERIGWRLAFDYTDAEVHGGSSAPQLTGLRPAQTPKWTVTGGLDLALSDRLSAAASFRYESGRWEDDLNTRRLSPGGTVDLRVGYEVADGAEFYVAADNLFSRRLEVGETADGVESFAAPRTIRVGFAYRR